MLKHLLKKYGVKNQNKKIKFKCLIEKNKINILK